MTLSFSKHLTTCAIASVSLIFDKNLLPRPSPFDAPSTKPAISTKFNFVGIVLIDFDILLKFISLSSGTETSPIFGSMVQNG